MARRAVAFHGGGEMNVDDVAGLDEGIGGALAGPLPVWRQQDDLRALLAGRADAGVNLQGQDAGDEGVHVVAGPGDDGPVGMPVVLEWRRRRSRGEPVVDHIFQVALPSVAALVGGQAIVDGAIGGLLQVQVERGVDAQAGLVDLLGAKALLEFLPHLFLKPGRDRALRLSDVETERRACAPARPVRG